MRPLDLVVVGASKSGTTSLFQYLRAHPRIYLPPGKDAPFFSADAWYERGWSWFLEEAFASAPPEALWGTVTPRYMEDSRVPERLAEHCPRARLVAILRHPVERAQSQHRQQVRRGKEARTLADAVAEQLEPAVLERARGPEGDRLGADDRYVVLGEYGRILGRFRTHFPAEQMLAVFTEELEADPGAVIDAILEHLGLEAGFRPPRLGERHHRGGSRERFPRLVPMLRHFAPVRGLWHLLPRHRRRAIWMWFFTRANVVPEPAPELAPELREKLILHYRADVRELERLVDRRVPWSDFYDPA